MRTMLTKPQEIQVDSEEIPFVINRYIDRKKEIKENLLVLCNTTEREHDMIFKKTNMINCYLDEMLNIEVLLNHLNNIDYDPR